MKNKKIIGKIGESLAAKYLEKNGYTIEKINYYCKFGEIDIIAKLNNMIIFIEVKTRTNLLYGYPVEAINNKKILHIRNSAKYYLYENKMYDFLIRFDVIEVYLKDYKYKINHIKDIIE